MLRVAGGTFILLIMIFVIARINQQVALSRKLKSLPAPGKPIDVNGHMFHLYCIGEGSRL